MCLTGVGRVPEGSVLVGRVPEGTQHSVLLKADGRGTSATFVPLATESQHLLRRDLARWCCTAVCELCTCTPHT